MTINVLQQALIDEIVRMTKDMSLIDRQGRPAELKGYPQAIPMQPVFKAVPLAYEEPWIEETPDEESLFPYFIVRADSVEYQKKDENGDESNQAHIMIAFAIYDDDSAMRGYYSLTAVMERVVERFQSDTMLGQFWCSRKMGLAYQEDDTYPQFFGALEMTWYLPEVNIEPGLEEFL